MTLNSPQFSYNATIVECTRLHDELSIIRVKPDGFDVEFVPGQYVELGMISAADGKLVRRQYSIASAPHEERGIELYIVRVEQGTLTVPLWEQSVGDRVWINPKAKGKFTIEEIPPGKNFILVATGTGLAPFISMIRHYESATLSGNVAIIHGVRIAADLGYDEELRAWEQRGAGRKYLPCVSREPGFSGLTGRIPDCLADGRLEHALGRNLSTEADQVLICGNPAMIDDLVKLLEIRGFSVHKKKSPGNIHFERYW